jgi:hypothetical protein
MTPEASQPEEWHDDAAPPTPPGRVPGKYIVYLLGAFLFVFMASAIVLALNLKPAADHFHNPPPASKKA